jgi:hypothetical protein
MARAVTKKRITEEESAIFTPSEHAIILDKSITDVGGFYYMINGSEVDSEIYNLERDALNAYLRNKCDEVAVQEFRVPAGVLSSREYRGSVELYNCPIGKVAVANINMGVAERTWVSVGKDSWRKAKRWAEDFLGDLVASDLVKSEEQRKELQEYLTGIKNLPE